MTAAIVERACSKKIAYYPDAARAVARRMNRQDDNDHPVTAYRCPFASDHEDVTRRWHVGGVPSMRTLERLSVEIRRRQGYELESL